MTLAVDPLRLLTAAGMVLAYVLMCTAIWLKQFRKHPSAPAKMPEHEQSPAWLVAFASQTGTAEDLAAQTAATLRLAGVSVRLCCLSELTLDELTRTERVLFLVSTYGEGDPPDNAAFFAGRLSGEAIPLSNLHYAVLALGDSSYANFCGFGIALDNLLREYGAQPLFTRIDVDQGDTKAIEAWRQHLSHLAGTSDLPDWSGPDFTDWKLRRCDQLNLGSSGEAVFQLELESMDAGLPDWQSGDLAQVLVPGDPDRPREYSIASIPEDGRVHLLVRLHRRADGSTGIASGWLASQAAVDGRVKMRLRQHRRFRLEGNHGRPLILIGNGTGIAGLRSHLKARVKNGVRSNWLIFGERNAACDFHYRKEIEAWREDGFLQRVDLAFSRDQPQRRYVQDCLAESGDMLRTWVDAGAAIYVCGSLKGMAADVDAMLATTLGTETLDTLSAAGRYRRDVY